MTQMNPSPITNLVDTVDTVASDDLATLFKSAADPLRIDVLRVLNQESFSVQELCVIFDIKQSAMSHHLKVLANAELISSRREGNFIFYQRNHQTPAAIQHLFASLFGAVDQISLNQEISENLQRVRQNRADLSQAFFSNNATKFKSQQELIATFDQYAEPLVEIVNGLQLPRRDTVIEVGPGEGAFLVELSPQFRHVVALDNSQEMLEQAQETATESKLSNITFINGDTQTALKQGLRADCVVVNMVLHHTPSPAAIFQDIAQLLLPGGSLLITELCHHNQTWVREACGDLWLGFEPQDLTYWAQAAELEPGQELYLALRNGFRFQIRHFIKPKP